MPAPNYIAQIHIEKNNAGISDEEYRRLLFEICHVSSSKDIQDEKQVSELVAAIKAEGQTREGWHSRQMSKWRQYVRFCGFDKSAAGAVLWKATGTMSEESPWLDQFDFDMAMVEIEEALRGLINAGEAKHPQGLDLTYWQTRNPHDGRANRRQINGIYELVDKIAKFAPVWAEDEHYVQGVIAQICRFDFFKAIEELKADEAAKVINAFKLRLEQEEKKAENNLKEVPF